MHNKINIPDREFTLILITLIFSLIPAICVITNKLKLESYWVLVNEK